MNWRAALLTAAVCMTVSWIMAWGIGQAITSRAVISQSIAISTSSGELAVELGGDAITRNVIVLGIVGTVGSLLVAVVVGVALKPKAPGTSGVKG